MCRIAPHLAKGRYRSRSACPCPCGAFSANENVKADVGRVAVERGPLVYCAEWPDNDGLVSNLVLDDEARP